MEKERKNHPEPVPAASQLAVLPFLAAVDGVITLASNSAPRRLTMHRVMAREGHGYIQQLCTYFGDAQFAQDRAGRMFPIDTGIMGEALLKLKVMRTRRYATMARLRTDLAKDLADGNDTRDPAKVPVSYLSIPFIGAAGTGVLALYAECDVLNFFANDQLLSQILAMCNGYCRLFDWLRHASPFPTLRNFPLEVKKFERAPPTVFRRLQEEANFSPPRFESINSFNYDSSPA